MKAFSDICTNPSAMHKYKDNPKVQKIIEKMGSLGGGMPGSGEYFIFKSIGFYFELFCSFNVFKIDSTCRLFLI